MFVRSPNGKPGGEVPPEACPDCDHRPFLLSVTLVPSWLQHGCHSSRHPDSTQPYPPAGSIPTSPCIRELKPFPEALEGSVRVPLATGGARTRALACKRGWNVTWATNECEWRFAGSLYSSDGGFPFYFPGLCDSGLLHLPATPGPACFASVPGSAGCFLSSF